MLAIDFNACIFVVAEDDAFDRQLVSAVFTNATFRAIFQDIDSSVSQIQLVHFYPFSFYDE